MERIYGGDISSSSSSSSEDEDESGMNKRKTNAADNVAKISCKYYYCYLFSWIFMLPTLSYNAASCRWI